MIEEAKQTLSEAHDFAGNRQTTQLMQLLAPMVEPLGYEIVHVEIVTQRQPILRLFIDHLNSTRTAQDTQGIGVQDCVKVSRALDEPLDLIPEVNAIFNGMYELEVSSPGVDRPLRRRKDFERFANRQVRVHLFRPLSADEIGNPAYQQKNPKQKNFLGTLRGLRTEAGEDRVVLALDPSGSPAGSQASAKKKSPKKAKAQALASTNSVPKNSVEEVLIPLPLISKANLEPNFDDLSDTPSEEDQVVALDPEDLPGDGSPNLKE